MPLSGAYAGCQAECGVASAMASAALVQLRGGSVEDILNASTLVLKNVLGLTCDPIMGFVEIPCIKRNVFLAIYAIVSSELALAKVKGAIPLDEVVDSMLSTGQMMSPLLKESAGGGLAKTKTAQNLENTLKL